MAKRSDAPVESVGFLTVGSPRSSVAWLKYIPKWLPGFTLVTAVSSDTKEARSSSWILQISLKASRMAKVEKPSSHCSGPNVSLDPACSGCSETLET